MCAEGGTACCLEALEAGNKSAERLGLKRLRSMRLGSAYRNVLSPSLPPRRRGLSMNMCGVDIHKSFLQVAVVDSSGKIIYREKCEYTPIALLMLVVKLLKLKCKQVVVESAGIYWIQFYYMLKAKNIEVKLANPV